MTNTAPRERRSVLPPGQRELSYFPRFGKKLDRPPPEVPEHPMIAISGSAIANPDVVPLTVLEDFPHEERTEDFHCVAGWTATGLHWGGVPFASFYRAFVEPRMTPGAVPTHVTFTGSDGWTATVLVEDALADEVLLANTLDGEPLPPDHGAPLRLVSPRQYGYINVKHVCGVEVHVRKPRSAREFSVFIRSHPRARVWEEERHGWFPAAVIRGPYRAVIRFLAPRIARDLR